MYSWLTEKLRTEFEEVRLLKESPRGSVRLIRHNAGGKQFILRRFQGNGEVYHRLLGCSCRYLPLVYEAAEQDGENIVVEEFVQGDTLDFLLKEALFSPQETKQTVKQLCHGLWVLHSMAAVHRDIKPENVILRGNDTPVSTSPRRSRTPISWAPPALPPRSSTAWASRIPGRTSTPWAC